MSATIKSKAKVAQGYTPKAIPQTCMNCANFASDLVPRVSTWDSVTYFDEKNVRCMLGGFVVKKMGTCNEFAGKPAP